MKKFLWLLLLIPITVRAQDRIIDGNQFSIYQRSKSEIVSKWNNEGYIPQDIDKYQVTPSYVSPYRASVLKDSYIEAVTDNLNYYRYLVGVPNTVEVSQNNSSLQTAEVIQTLNVDSGGNLTHDLSSFSKPSNMSQDFYNLGVNAIHTIVGYQAPSLTEPNYIFLDESQFSDTASHRGALLSPKLATIDYGIGDRVIYGLITTDESRYNTMDNDFAAYPSPGYFPKQDLASISDWDVYLNNNSFKILNSSEVDNIVVRITNKTDDTTEYRSISDGGLYYDSFNNRLVILAPTRITTYYEGEYEVLIENLKDIAGSNNIDIKYTVKFFDKYEGINGNIEDLGFDLNLQAIHIDGGYDNSFILRALADLGMQIYLDSGAVLYESVDNYNISNLGSNKYRAFVDISMPSYVKDPYNLISSYGYINIYTNPDSYHFGYDKLSYSGRVMDNVTMDIASFVPNNYLTASGEVIKSLIWLRDDGDELTLLDDLRFSTDNDSLTISNLKMADSGNYYACYLVFVPYSYYGDTVYQLEMYYSKAINLDISGYMGDMNQNGVIDIKDIIELLRIYLGVIDTSEEDMTLGDINKDNRIGMQDIISLLRMYLEI